jgi:hypothetical protein
MTDRDDRAKPKQADILLGLADVGELLLDANGEAFMVVPVGNHRETWPVSSQDFRRWLIGRYYHTEGKAPNQQAVRSALDTIEAQAHHEGCEANVFLRVGRSQHDGYMYLDLCDREWRAVEVRPDGWRVVTQPPVRFRRARGMLPLPEPCAGGSVDLLSDFLNVGHDDDFILLVATVVGAFRPQGPYPITILSGEQGSAKSTTARVVRELVDPNSTPLRAAPREERDLMIAANNGWYLAFDNLSRVPQWLSDGLCRLATGGGFATRELYTDREEVLFDAMRPIIVNSIGEPIDRDDLRDRGVFISLPPISDRARLDERNFWEAFSEARAYVLGALLDAVACALANEARVNLPEKPRLADFAIWVSAAEGSLSWEPGRFLDAYQDNRQAAIEASVEDSPLSVLVVELARERGEWMGTATDLLELLACRATEESRRQRSWPKSPRWLSGDLRRAAASLRRVGVTVEFTRERVARRRRLITITDHQPSENRVQTVQLDTDEGDVDDVDAGIPLFEPYAEEEREAIQAEAEGRLV